MTINTPKANVDKPQPEAEKRQEFTHADVAEKLVGENRQEAIQTVAENIKNGGLYYDLIKENNFDEKRLRDLSNKELNFGEDYFDGKKLPYKDSKAGFLTDLGLTSSEELSETNPGNCFEDYFANFILYELEKFVKKKYGLELKDNEILNKEVVEYDNYFKELENEKGAGLLNDILKELKIDHLLSPITGRYSKWEAIAQEEDEKKELEIERSKTSMEKDKRLQNMTKGLKRLEALEVLDDELGKLKRKR